MNVSIHPRAPMALRKRDGRQAGFDLGKILRAIRAAGQATGEFDPDVAAMLADLVQSRLVDRDSLATTDVQDVVERGLMETGYYATARAFIVHGERRRYYETAAAS